MKLNQVYLALGATFLLLPFTFAQSNEDTNGISQSTDNDEIVFTASRANQKANTIGSTLHVITEKELEEGQYQRVTDALVTIPGVNLTTNSANGQGNIFIRGMTSNNILVMVDGVIVNDPSDGGRGFDYSTLDTLNVDRIEVLKGPQSTLYGSSASAGVIQVFTKKGGPQQTTLTLEGGNYEHVKTTVQTQGQTDKLMYSAALGLNQEHGISVADKKLGNPERDRYKNRNGSFYVNYAPNDWLNFDVSGNYNQQYKELDKSPAPKGDALNYYMRSERWFGRVAMNTILFDEKWLSTVSYDINDSRRHYYRDPDGQYDKAYTRSAFKGQSQTVAWQNTLILHPDFQTLFGASYSRESMRSFTHSKPNIVENIPKHSTNQTSFYLDQHLNFGDRFFNTVGLRYEDHSEFGDKVTYRLTSRFNINDYVAIKGSYGTGFKAPTMFQLYDPVNGNKDLSAETSKGFDVGLVITPHKTTTVNLTYFQQKIENRIVWVQITSVPINQGTYINRDLSKYKGFEFSTDTKFNGQLSLGVNYTYTNARDFKNTNGIQVSSKAVRVPQHMAGGHISYKPTERISIFTEGKYHGSTNDGKKNLRPYWLVNVAADYKVNDDVSVYARVNNVLDKHYYNVWGYGQKRINGAIGVKIKF